MSSSSDEDDFLMFLLYRRMKKKKRRSWAHPYIERNSHDRLFVGARELQQSDTNFLAFYRMSKESYIALVRIVSPAIQYVDTNMRECVNAEERVLITLRYLATGCTFVSLGRYFCRGETTVGKIVSETTKIIWNSLRNAYMGCPSGEEWETIARRFRTLWNLPNCIGALGVKHIRIEKLHDAGQANYKYLALLGCSDADGTFTMIETIRNCDGGVFRNSAMKKMIFNSQLDIPPPSDLPSDDCLFPYYFVGDEAFPLSRNLLRPYSKRILDNTKRIFNYRLSRGAKSIERAFGMMTEKFQVLGTAIRCRDGDTIDNIVKCVCVLHNYVMKSEGCQYSAPGMEQRAVVLPTGFAKTARAKINNCSTAYAIRDYLAHYFLTPSASLPCQWDCCI